MKRYSRVTYEARYQISALRQAEIDPAQMAAQLGYHRSTIYRELKRNRTCRPNSFIKTYDPDKANKLALRRRKNCRRSLKLVPPVVNRGLSGGWVLESGNDCG